MKEKVGGRKKGGEGGEGGRWAEGKEKKRVNASELRA